MTSTQIDELSAASSAANTDQLLINTDAGGGAYACKNITVSAFRTSLLSGSAVTSLTGTAAEITASAATGAVTLSLPSALTFTGKTITGGTFASPTLTTPALGTPSAGVLTSCTGLPIGSGVSGLGTGVATALGVNVGSAGAPVLFNGACGTPSSLTGTNITGTAAGLSIGGNAATATSATSATSATTATTATNIAGGAAGAVPYQSGSGATSLLSAGSSGQIIRSGGAGAPTWSTATYPDAAGTSGNVLTSDGTNWNSTAPAGITQSTGNFGTLPTITGSGSNPTITFTTQTAKYVKTSKTVTNEVVLVINTASGGSGSTQITNALSDAPLTDVSCTIGYFQAASGISSSYQMLSLVVLAGTTTGLLYGYNLGAGTSGQITNGNMAAAGNAIKYSATYQIP